MYYNFTKRNEKGGFLVLTMVLLVCAVVLVISTGVLLRSVGEMQGSGDSEKALIAWGAVNACAEHALLQLASTTDTPGWEYAGDEELPLGSETCYIYSIEASSTSKLIKASSTVSLFTSKLLIEVATNTPNIVVSSWEKVEDF